MHGGCIRCAGCAAERLSALLKQDDWIKVGKLGGKLVTSAPVDTPIPMLKCDRSAALLRPERLVRR